ncbi:unnamed protein product [Cunninghamella echinulata]
MYDYDAQQEEELTVKEDEILVLYENDDPDWYLVKSRNGAIGLTPSNYVELISEENTINHSITNQDSATTVNVSNSVNTPSPLNTQDEALSWLVHEYDSEKKKKKKSKGNLLIGNGLLCYGSETDKSIPVQQFSILDVNNYHQDGKNIHISLNDTNHTVFDFQSASKSEAKAMITKLDESLSIANHHQTTTSSVTPSPEHDVYHEATPSLSISAPPTIVHSEHTPSASVPELTPEPTPEPETEQLPLCEPRWSIVLYDFDGQEEEELTVKENDQVLAIDYISSEDWWTVELQDGRTGIIPATYVKFQDEYEAEIEATQQQHQELLAEQQHQLEAQKERQRKLEEEKEKERQKQLEQQQLEQQQQQQQQLAKERERQLEADRRRKMQEEAKQREIDAKRAAARSAATNSPQISAAAASSPRRSQIPAPPPPTVRSSPAARHVTPPPPPQPTDTNQHHHHQQPKNTHDNGKPDSSKIRTWTDRTGAFKVEAQLLACHNGKIRLHKANGVKIDVPVHKMCLEDLRYIEQETGARLIEDKNDNIPLAHLANTSSSSNKNDSGFNWLDFFTKINIPNKHGLHYAAAFQQEGLGEKDLDYLTHKRMKNLGMTENHVRRLQKYIESQTIDPPSDGEAVHKDNHTPIFGNKKMAAKKTVTFGSTSIIHDDDDDEFDNLDETTRRQRQIEEDERLARELQQQENDNRGGSSSLHRRGTGRPVPTNSAPKDMNSQIMDKIKSQLSTEPLKPSNTSAGANNASSPQFLNTNTNTNTNTTPTSTMSSSPLLSSSSESTNTNQIPGFKDDAWATRTIENKNPNLQAQQILENSSSQSSTSSTLTSEERIKQQIAQIQQYQQQQKLQQQQQQQEQLLEHQRIEYQRLQEMIEQKKQELMQQQQQIQLQQQQQQQQQVQLQQQQQVPLPPRQRPTPQISQVNRIDPQLLNQWTGNNSSPSQLQQQPSPLMQTMLTTGSIQPSLPPRSPNQLAQSLPQQQQFGTPVFSQNQAPTMLQAQMTGYVPSNQSSGAVFNTPSVLPPPLQPTAAPLKPQATGRNWATATPANPFGNDAQVVSQSPSPNMTPYSGNLQSSPLQPAQVFASMTGTPNLTMQQPQQTGFIPQQQQQPTNINDPYSVFKSMNPQGPNVFNPQQPQQQMGQFQQPQQTGFIPQQQQQPFQGGRW